MSRLERRLSGLVARASGDFALLGSPSHRALAREAVRKSLVLLKNEDGLLPLKPTRDIFAPVLKDLGFDVELRTFNSGHVMPEDKRAEEDGRDQSYVTHRRVRRYLEDYADEFRLKACIQFGCTVEQLTVLHRHDDAEWPQISLRWKVRDEHNAAVTQQQTFDRDSD